MKKQLKHALVAGAITAAFGAGSALPASAHYLQVDSPGKGPGLVWVGGPVGLDANGKGLVVGGPGGDELMPPSHVKGMVTACLALRYQTNAAADISGPPPIPGNTCRHGMQPDFPDDES